MEIHYHKHFIVDILGDFLKSNFEFCEVTGYKTNRYGIKNKETGHRVIYILAVYAARGPSFEKIFIM